MSTRSAICRLTDEGELTFIGRFHHWDGYPSGVGKTLFEILRSHFGGDIEAMLKVLIDDHPGGWSTINRNWDLPVTTAQEEDDNAPCRECHRTKKQHTKRMHAWRYVIAAEDSKPPICYCYPGHTAEQAYFITEQTLADTWCEYAYLFNVDSRHLLILDSSDLSKYPGVMFKKKQGGYERWSLIADVNLDGDEPDWGALDRAGNDEDEAAS